MGASVLFTKKQLKDLANAASFQRGVGYYDEGSVKNVVRRGNEFQGKVQGSSRYKVKLAVDGGNLHFECSCPYDYGGICKHAVALGLAVLEGDYQTEAIEVDYAEEATLVSDPSTEALFEAFFPKVDEATKMAFLRTLLAKDAYLRAQFLHFVQYQDEQPGEATPGAVGPVSGAAQPDGVSIEAVRKDVHGRLSALDFDDLDYDEYEQEYDHYAEGWEVEADIAKEMIGEVFEKPAERALGHARRGNLPDGFRVILGMYEAAATVTEPAADDHGIFEGLDYQETVLEQFAEVLVGWLDEAEKVVRPEAAVKQLYDLLLERYQHHEDRHRREVPEPQRVYELKHFEPFFFRMLTGPEVARHLLHLFTTHRLVDVDTVLVVLRIAELTNDETLWLKTAAGFVDSQPTIARQLLEKYRAKDRMDDFYRLAEKMMQDRAHEFDQYLLETVPPGANRALHVAALVNFTRRTHSVPHYRELRNYLTKEQRNVFIANESRGYNFLFYVQLLTVEERFADILQFVRKIKADHVGDFEKLIEPIADVYPQECFDIVVVKCDRELQAQGRGRQHYQNIARLLKILLPVKSLREEVKVYALHLYNSKPILPALRDEMKKVGLM
ncbi:MAG: hypothetical protein H7Z75_00910 [Ferruginibacter sp.]|nr:hypothetical protein [Cytophagales bacterium]